MFKMKRKTKEMIEVMFLILLVVSVLGGLFFTAGYLTGRTHEQQKINNFIERYYNGGNNDDY